MEENKETVDNEVVDKAVGTQANENKDEGKAERTYTQEEYNALDKKLKAKYEKKYEGIDLKAYNEWVESKKTAEQKQAEREAEYLKKDSKISDLEKEIAVLKAGVKDDIDYVLFKVSRMEGDFKENLAKFLKDNPKFTSSENKVIKTVGTSAKLDGNTRTENTTNQTMNDLIRSVRN
jgi:hypothetical protein